MSEQLYNVRHGRDAAAGPGRLDRLKEWLRARFANRRQPGPVENNGDQVEDALLEGPIENLEEGL